MIELPRMERHDQEGLNNGTSYEWLVADGNCGQTWPMDVPDRHWTKPVNAVE